MSVLKFKAIIEIREDNPYILVSQEQATALKAGWKKPLPVKVQVNRQPKPAWKINMMPVGDGSFYLYLHVEVRKASKTKVGDEVEVTLSFDETYKSGPMHPIPDWFKKALDKNKNAKKNWGLLAPSRQKEILRYFSWLKSQEAIDRNLKRAIEVLEGEPKRFMARSWKNGS